MTRETCLMNSLVWLWCRVPGTNHSSGYSVLPVWGWGQRLGEGSPERSIPYLYQPLPIWMPGLDCSIKTFLMRLPLYTFQSCGNLRDEFPVGGDIADLFLSSHSGTPPWNLSSLCLVILLHQQWAQDQPDPRLWFPLLCDFHSMST